MSTTPFNSIEASMYDDLLLSHARGVSSLNSCGAPGFVFSTDSLGNPSMAYIIDGSMLVIYGVFALYT